jgi:uncharacterized metal-binding protein
MPSGIVHHKVWKICWIFALPGSICLGIVKDPISGVAFGSGYLFGNFCDPDWDEMSATGSEGRMVKIPILGWILYGISSVYGAIFRRYHRSFFTHFPFVSTAIRLLFVFFWIPILYYFKVIKWQDWQGIFYLWFWIGLSCADTLHWGADMLVSDVKKIHGEPNWNKEENKLRS